MQSQLPYGVRHDIEHPLLAAALGVEEAALRSYELGFYAHSNLMDILNQRTQEYLAAVHGSSPRGDPYTPGSVLAATGMQLYLTVRVLRPQIIVETGVCNGYSSAFLLQGLADADAGRLVSIDLPEIVGEPAIFWEGKGGSAVPAGRSPGWVIPENLRDRWELRLGRSQEILPEVLASLDRIDLFFHDSEHSFDCMWLEFELGWPRLKPGGVLAADDVGWNSAFYDFAKRERRTSHSFRTGLGMLQR